MLPILFVDYALLGIIFFLGVAFFILVYEHLKLKKKYYEEAEIVLEEADKKALGVILQANIEAKQIMNTSNLLQADTQRLITQQAEELRRAGTEAVQQASEVITTAYRNTLTELTSNILQDYQSALAKVKDEDINTFKSISNISKDVIDAEMKDFKLLLQKQTYSSEKEIQQKVEESYAKIQQELEVHEVAQLKKIDDNILKIIQTIAKDVLQKAIKLEDHEKLILESLEKAKTQFVNKEYSSTEIL